MNNNANQNKDLGSELAYAALDEIPTPKSDAKEIFLAYLFSESSTIFIFPSEIVSFSGIGQGLSNNPMYFSPFLH